MHTEKFSFGMTADGCPVTAFRLCTAAGTSVTLLDYGAAVQSLCVPDRGGRARDVVLGYDTAAEYESSDGCLGATIGRMANRIGGAAFSMGGKTYRLAQNDGENHLHGGMRGFNRRMWRGEFQGGAVRFTRLSPDGEEGYPGNLSVSVTFALTEQNCLRISYDADTDQDTIVSLTNHSYFNLNGGGTALEHELQIFAARILENDRACLPTGRILSVEGTPFDFREAKPVGKEIDADDSQLCCGRGYDHNFVLSGPLAAVLRSRESGISMTVRTDLPGMQVYTANGLSCRNGKNGREMGPRGAVCMETQLFPNAMACYGFPSPILRAGHHLHTETCFEFETF